MKRGPSGGGSDWSLRLALLHGVGLALSLLGVLLFLSVALGSPQQGSPLSDPSAWNPLALGVSVLLMVLGTYVSYRARGETRDAVESSPLPPEFRSYGSRQPDGDAVTTAPDLAASTRDGTRCSNCGAVEDDGYTFCANCGEKLN